MTPEEKQLLFKDLCARLPYGVVIHTDCEDVKLDRNHCGIGMLYYEHYSEELKKECGYDENDCSIIISGCYYGDIKPYLRLMSSMTKKEKEIYRVLCKKVIKDLYISDGRTQYGEKLYRRYDKSVKYYDTSESIDFLTSSILIIAD